MSTDAELDLLVAFAEWLDSRGLIVGENPEDRRTLEEIAAEFRENKTGDPRA